ncbi:MAG: L-histidine N(alpha)-methyltransferase, partial [Steroidobacteraceae bacterium]
PKYYYDDLGSRLFDQICDTEEYYLTRSEQSLLDRIAVRLVLPRYTDLIELGSGAARKTRALLDAIGGAPGRAPGVAEIAPRPEPCRYVPFDVSEAMLKTSACRLLDDYPWLTVHGIVADYERHVDELPRGARRLVMFLGSTIGNFESDAAVRLLGRIARQLGDGDRLLLGTDLVKDHARLNAAYNDAQGITIEFNKNVLRVINRELGGHFELEHFEHVAYFVPERSQVEIFLESTRDQTVRIDALELDVKFVRGERILTEISRKYTRASVADMLEAAGLLLDEWFVSRDEAFALSVARPKSPSMIRRHS